MDKKINLRDISLAELEELVVGLGESKYRAKQVTEWLYKRKAASIDEMSNLSLAFRKQLSEKYSANGLEVLNRQESIDGTVKYLFGLEDGESIETVYMPEGDRGTVCISTQVGCALGCSFCATATLGFKRNLSASEILNQVIEVQRDLEQDITNLVFMGMGEPLDNISAVDKALSIFTSDKGFGLGMRRITVSTSGLIPAMEKFGKLWPNINLAVSLHAVDEETRKQLMPITKKYPVSDLLKASASHPLQKTRKVTFELILFDGVNDSDGDLEKLIKAVKPMRAKINLISLNSVEGSALQPSPRVDHFFKVLNGEGIVTTKRKSRGSDIDAACGQLKARR